MGGGLEVCVFEGGGIGDVQLIYETELKPEFATFSRSFNRD